MGGAVAVERKFVFGVHNNRLPESFIQRMDLEEVIKTSIDELRHIVVYGGTKQGKSSLLNCSFQTEKIIKIKPSDSDDLQWIIEALYKNVMRRYGKSVHTSRVRNIEDIRDELKSISNQVQVDEKHVVILENYHYILKKPYAKALLQQVRNAIEDDFPFVFIFVGIVNTQDITSYLNGDLGGRLTQVTLEPWPKEELKKVVLKGTSLLEIKVEKKLVDEVVEKSYGNVGILQIIMESLVKTSQEKFLKYESSDWFSGILGRSLSSIIGGHSRSLLTGLLNYPGGNKYDKDLMKYFVHFLFYEYDGKEIFLNQVTNFVRKKMDVMDDADNPFEKVVEKLIHAESLLFQVINEEIFVIDNLLKFYLNFTVDEVDNNKIEISLE